MNAIKRMKGTSACWSDHWNMILLSTLLKLIWSEKIRAKNLCKRIIFYEVNTLHSERRLILYCRGLSSLTLATFLDLPLETHEDLKNPLENYSTRDFGSFGMGESNDTFVNDWSLANAGFEGFGDSGDREEEIDVMQGLDRLTTNGNLTF